MANHVLVTTFLPQERFEPKVIPPEKDNNYSIMIHHGEKGLVGLRMTKGQLVALYGAIRGALQGTSLSGKSVIPHLVNGYRSQHNKRGLPLYPDPPLRQRTGH